MKNFTKLSIFLFILTAVIFSAGFALAQQYNTVPDYNYNYNYNNYPSCNYHAYRDCVGSAIYWFDSCATRQDLYQDCASFGQTCQYGMCVPRYIPAPAPTPIPNPAPNPTPNPYIAHYKTVCYSGNLYWYDSLGNNAGLYKACADSNSCTLDSCQNNECSNVLKCDGSTCAAGSADYNSYCQPAQPNTPVNHPAMPANVSIMFSAKKNTTDQQWEKTVEVGQNSAAYFMIAINNSSSSQIDNVNVSVNIPSEISFLGNLEVDNVAFAGDIVSGISVGSIGPGSTKSITFEGKTQTFNTQGQKQAVATINVSGTAQSDSVTLNFNPSQSNSAPASVSSPSSASEVLTFLKRWYLWILVGVVLIFLFVVVFRRLSGGGE